MGHAAVATSVVVILALGVVVVVCSVVAVVVAAAGQALQGVVGAVGHRRLDRTR